MQPYGGDPSQSEPGQNQPGGPSFTKPQYGQPAPQPYSGGQGQQPYGQAPYPQQPYPPQPYAPQPYGYVGGYGRPGAPSAVGWVVLAFIFFWPLGIAAVINQLKIGPAWQIGDDGGAYRAAASAKKFGLIALCVGIAWIALVIILEVAVFSSVHHGCDYSSDYC